MAGSMRSRRSGSTVSAGSGSLGSSRNLRRSMRSGNNWKRNIHFKTTVDDKKGTRKSFFKAILDGYSIKGKSIPASWYTSVWDTEDNKLVAFVTKVALHAHMRDDEDSHYASNLDYVINKAPTAQAAMSCTKDKKHYCITHVAPRGTHTILIISRRSRIYSSRNSLRRTGPNAPGIKTTGARSRPIICTRARRTTTTVTTFTRA